MKKEKKLGIFDDNVGSSRKFKMKSKTLETSYKKYQRMKLNTIKISKPMVMLKQNMVMEN